METRKERATTKRLPKSRTNYTKMHEVDEYLALQKNDMAINNLVKRLQNIMRQDAGVNGDAQRIEQMVWLMFLKAYDTPEQDWKLDDTN